MHTQKKKKLKAHERHSANISWCCATLHVEDKHVHTFELGKQANMKKEEKFSFETVLTTYDSSNDCVIGFCDTDEGYENGMIN